jgi:hypothetical protein
VVEEGKQTSLAKNSSLRLFVLGLSVSLVVYGFGTIAGDLTPNDAWWVFTSCTFATTVIGMVFRSIEANPANKFAGSN